MAVITVNGEICADDLGPTAAHEHIFCDFSKDYVEPPNWVKDFLSEQGLSLEEPISLKTLGLLMREPLWSVYNQILSDYDDAEEELALLKRAGVRSVIDPTCIGVGRNPSALRKLSQKLGMHLIAATGYYRSKFHPPETEAMTVDDIEERMLQEITVGIEGTGIRAGVMGELGTTRGRILPNELKTMIAAGRVNRATNAPIMVHAEGGLPLITEVLRILKENGANLEKVHICHICQAPHWKEVADTGASIGLDNFGYSFCVDSEVYMPSTDTERISHLKRILDAGYGHKVLIGNDICMKMRLHKYGGWGYDHIQTNLVPYMKKAGITDEQLHTLFVENPKHFLDTAC